MPQAEKSLFDLASFGEGDASCNVNVGASAKRKKSEQPRSRDAQKSFFVDHQLSIKISIDRILHQILEQNSA